MKRLALALVVVLAACGGEEGSGSTTSTNSVSNTTEAGPTQTTVDALPTTTVPATTTTLPGATTTTTTTIAVVAGPNLPSSLPGASVPWSDVGDGWYVVLYDSSNAMATGPSDEGPVVLYLVGPDGTRYETASWPTGDRPWSIADVRPDGTAAVVVGTGATPDDTVWTLVDLPTGAMQTVHEASFPEVTLGWGSTVGLTRPTGTNLVVYRSDGTDEWLERRSPGGSVLATLYRQEYIDPVSSLRWLYGYDGTTALVAHHGGLALVRNDGSLVRELWVPMDHRCDPVRWWDADTILAACYGLGPASAPVDEFGAPHTYYGQLWLLETDGSAGSSLTSLPGDPVIVVDFGYHDAWPVGGTTYVDWSGDCGASDTRVLQSDGTAAPLSISIPASIVADGWTLIDVVSGQFVVYAWQGCAADVGVLFAVDGSGQFTHELVPVAGDARGVIDVRGLATVHP
jgi:TolB protein